MPEPPPTPPLDLPRQVLRRGAVVALAVLALALLLGLARMRSDIAEELDAAMSLATLVAELGASGAHDDRTALERLAEQQRLRAPRHLQLRVHDDQGRLLLGPPPEAPPAPPLGALLALHRGLLSAPETRFAAWTVNRPSGAVWRVSLAASAEGERREAMQSLLGVLALLLACTAALLVLMRWNLVRAFAPLGRLLAAIAGIERGDTRAVRSLAAMPTRELESVAGALRHLAQALDEAEAQRRALGRQVQTLQEDERSRIARELHDEFGQRLTAMRVDAAFLQRQLAGDATLQAVAGGMAAQCAQIQQDIRLLLAQLQPFGPGGEDAAAETLQRLADALRGLVAVWAAAGVVLQLDWQPDAATPPAPWPDRGGALALQRALALALYRISQEALTNVARHAQARHARLALRIVGPWRAGAAWRIEWSVQDDGAGIADPAQAAARGIGLAGMRERVWALGGDLRFADAQPGLRVEATLQAQALAQALVPVSTPSAGPP